MVRDWAVEKTQPPRKVIEAALAAEVERRRSAPPAAGPLQESGALRFREQVTPYRLVCCEDLESLRSMMVNGAFACAFEGDHSILVPIPDAGSHAGDDWACFRIDADIPLGAVGVAAEVTGLLAAADISVLVMSGYRTDYFLVRDSQRQPARDALIGGGHSVSRECGASA